MPTGPIIFSVTAGQSLAGGSTRFEDVLTNAPVYPTKALGLDFGSTFFLNKGFGDRSIDTASATFQGFTPLLEYDSETPMTSMVNRIVYEYQQHGLTAPTIAAFNTSSGGKSILTLMTKQSETFDSVAAGLASSQIGVGDVFAVDLHTSDHQYAYYKKTPDNGSFYYRTLAVTPVMFDNYVKQLKLGYDAAVAAGYQIDPHLVINWIQGEDDRDTPEYDYLLNKLLDKFKVAAETIFGKSVQLVAAISQTQGNGHIDVAIDQLSVINSRADTILGAPQYQQRVLYPSSPLFDYDHLTPEGYFVFGQQIGANIFNKLVGNENKPIEISSITATSETRLIVKFSGLIGSLVDDQAAYNASLSLRPPSDFGFRVYTANGDLATSLPDISNAKIIGSNLVQLDFSSSILGSYRLYLGRTDESLITQGSSGFGLAGTTLRDSSVISALKPADPTNTLHYNSIYDFVPVQYVDLNISAGNIGQEIPTPIPLDEPATSNVPTSIILSPAVVDEDRATGTPIGLLSTTDPDVGDRHVYALVNGSGSGDNRLVQIAGDTLQVRWLINFEDSHTLHVRVRSTDLQGHKIERKLVITVHDIADTVASPGNDFLAGSRSADSIKGLAGNDLIYGYASADVLSGGLGNDTLSGGAGSDRFLLNQPTSGFDTILDFGPTDVITIKGVKFGLGNHLGTLPKGFLRIIESGDPAAADSNDHFVFRQDDNTLWFDPDGTAPGVIRAVAVLNDFDLRASDILIV